MLVKQEIIANVEKADLALLAREQNFIVILGSDVTYFWNIQILLANTQVHYLLNTILKRLFNSFVNLQIPKALEKFFTKQTSLYYEQKATS